MRSLAQVVLCGDVRCYPAAWPPMRCALPPFADFYEQARTGAWPKKPVPSSPWPPSHHLCYGDCSGVIRQRQSPDNTLGAPACETNCPPRAGLLGCSTWQHLLASCSACVHGYTHKSRRIAADLHGHQSWRSCGSAPSALPSCGWWQAYCASYSHARSGAACRSCQRIVGYEHGHAS